MKYIQRNDLECKLKVAVYYNNNDIRIEERPVPSISEEEILVKMKASGICGTDVMQWYRIKKAPCVLGHEMAGEVVEIGSRVKGFKKGDRVFVTHHVPCYECYYCKQEKYTACEFLHAGNYEPGGFSEFIRVPKENVKYGTFLLPEKMTFEEATMIEPLGCVIAGQNEIDLKEGQTVLIIGAGVTGILHIQVSKIKKTKIVAIDIRDYKLDKALEFGADYVFDAMKYSPDQLKKINSNRLADTVILCSSSTKAVENALYSVDKKGKILFFAVPETDITIPSLRFWRHEITLIFSYGASPSDIQRAIELIGNDSVNVKDIVTHKVSLSNIQQGFNIASEAKESLKVVVVPDAETEL